MPDPRYGRNGDRGQTSALDGQETSDNDQELQLECDLIAYISRSSSQTRSFEKDIQPRIAHLGLAPAEVPLQEWLQQKSAVFDIDGDLVSLTKESLQYDQHLESQFVTLLQRIGRPAHLGKDVASYCRKHNIDIQVSYHLAPLVLLSSNKSTAAYATYHLSKLIRFRDARPHQMSY